MNREEAISIIKELLESCTGLDGQNVQLTPPIAAGAGYQVMLIGAFTEETVTCVKAITAKHDLTLQMGNIWKTKRSGNFNTLIIFDLK